MKNNLGNKTVMAENIKFYMQIHEENRKDLSKLFDVPYTTLCDWINGKTYPRIDKIVFNRSDCTVRIFYFI